MKICPKCNSLAAYDPYFGCTVCRYCYWMERESITEKDVNVDFDTESTTKEATVVRKELV